MKIARSLVFVILTLGLTTACDNDPAESPPVNSFSTKIQGFWLAKSTFDNEGKDHGAPPVMYQFSAGKMYHFRPGKTDEVAEGTYEVQANGIFIQNRPTLKARFRIVNLDDATLSIRAVDEDNANLTHGLIWQILKRQNAQQVRAILTNWKHKG